MSERKKLLYPCPVPGCGEGMLVVKSWLTPEGLRKQRVKCKNKHVLTLDIPAPTPDPISLNRLMRRIKKGPDLNIVSRET